jgi:hypothetical protein
VIRPAAPAVATVAAAANTVAGVVIFTVVCS